MALIVTLLGLLAKAAGGLQAPNTLLDGFSRDCDGEVRSCWQGIVPGVTTVGAARAVVEALGYKPDNTSIELSDHVFVFRSEELNPACIDIYYLPGSGRVESVLLRCLTLRTGDIMLQAGAPSERWGTPGRREAFYHPGKLVVFLQYGQQYLSPHNIVEAVYVRAQENNLFNPATAIGWHGFAPLWRYCQLEVDYPLCGVG